MSFNTCTLVGNITRKPEIKYTPKGVCVAEFGIACNEVWYDEGGNKKESVSFFDIVAWDKGAEWAEKHLEKGAEILVFGKLKQETWQDRETGSNRSKVKIVAERLVPTFGTWKDGRGAREDESHRSTQAPGPKPPPQRPEQPQDPDLDQPNDDLPY